MRNNILKLFILGILIIGCIWQTTILWLGDLSSHNFLQQNKAMRHIVVQPKSIWVNVGKLAYNIQEVQGRYETRLTDELVEKLQEDFAKVEIDKSISYEDVFNKQGIIYEYGTYLTLNEIVGMDIIKTSSPLKINNILVDLSDYSQHKTYLYLVGEEDAPIYKVTLSSKLEMHYKVLDNVSLNTSDIKYQASITCMYKDYINGNVFLPIINQEDAMLYEELYLKNKVQQEMSQGKNATLLNYVDALFENPYFKKVEEISDGSIIYTEGQKTSVKYSPLGTLEFNVTSSTEPDKLSKSEKMIMINDFINETGAIPNSMKQGLYLSNIIEDTNKGQTIYQFEYQHDSIGVYLSEEFKKALQINAMVELVIKNNQIVKGKWMLLDIKKDHDKDHETIRFEKDFNTVISEYYTGQKLNNLRCSYIVDGLDKPITFDWIYDRINEE